MFSKRGVEYQGMDCLDESNAMYMKYMNMSQAEIPWASQTKYAEYTVYFGVVIIFVALLKQVYYRIRDSTYNPHSNSSNPFTSFVDVLVSYCRYVGYKQTPRYLQFFASFPKSVGSSLFMALSTLYLACYCFVPHYWYRGCAGFGSPPLAVRAGLMSTALVPFIYVLAGKSNAITLLTGISYEKLNVFHQYVGVAGFVLGVVHTIPFIYQQLQEAGASAVHKSFVTDLYYISGIPTLILMGLLCTLSKAWIRKHCYELFLHLHWIMGIAFFACLIWHIQFALGAQNYMWGALAFWGSQLIYRILVKTCFKPSSMFLKSRVAHLTKLDEGTYEIQIENVKGYTWTPGQHVFLRFKGWRLLDSHPFSVSTTTEQGAGMKFIVVPKSGLTKHHFRELDRQIELNKQVYIDGPYGGTFRDVSKFDKLVLVASGSGVTATIPFLSYIAQLHQSKSPLMDNLKCVNFIWVVRYQKNIKWIEDELIRCQNILGRKLQLDIRVCDYLLEMKPVGLEKKKNVVDDDDDDDDEKHIESEQDGASTNLPITYGKPDVRAILTSLTSSFAKRNIVVCSGSHSMQRQVSQTVSDLQPLVFNNDLRNTNVEEIYLHTECFGW
ncbi:FRE7 [Candida theae]|uniref:ferric-chelate reductase (NADPH) n=1 Tax=Candida theae TaxID=1198502 RepID=A0AAD5FXU2_9ASCO|nr:FRE7 [Candida theae]KAI5956001.1 FRE7 [Candida theae]